MFHESIEGDDPSQGRVNTTGDQDADQAQDRHERPIWQREDVDHGVRYGQWTQRSLTGGVAASGDQAGVPRYTAKGCRMRNLIGAMLAARRGLMCLLVAAAVAAGPTPGLAGGITRIQHSDGRQFEYPGATLRLSKGKQQLTIISPDGRDTLIVGEAACSWVGELQRCLLGKITLQKKGGAAEPIGFDQGTAYVNLTTEKLHLPLSTKEVPPNGIVLAMHTLKGTFINVTGFWGALAIGANTAAVSAAVYGSIVASNNQTYTSYQVQPNSPGATLLANYQLTQVPCGPPDLVVIYGPDNSVICAAPNNLVSPGFYDLDPTQLSIVSQTVQ
jgi:hypothetical protein